jgi:hypothetical protein
MLPRIKKVEFGKIHVNNDILTDDFFIHPNGLEMVEKTRKIGKKEFEKMLLHDPSVAILGIGFKKKMQVSDDVFDAAKKSKVDLHVLPTPDALKKFQEFARKGKNVVAHIHVGE